MQHIDDNLDEAWVVLATPLGQAGSAKQRYAAAMTLYQNGLVCAEVLEVYRVLTPKDVHDPLVALQQVNLPTPKWPN